MNVFMPENSAAMDNGRQSMLSDITAIGHSWDMHATDHNLTHAAFQPHGCSVNPYAISDWASRIINITRDDWIAHGCYKPKVKKYPASAVKPKPVLQPNRVFPDNYPVLVTA